MSAFADVTERVIPGNDEDGITACLMHKATSLTEENIQALQYE